MVVINGHLGFLICSDVEDSFFNIQLTSKRSKQDEVVLGMGSGVILLFITTLLVVWIRKKGYGRREGSGRSFPARFSLAEIKSAKKGDSWVVYEGSLASGKEVVGCLKHKNLVQLIGCCCEGDELVLVYNLMPNGNLDRFLHFTGATNRTSLLGVASALTYLHEESETQIIHRDVKACNIMLDGDYNVKLGDFGLAELYERKFSTSARTATTPAGMMGYLAPEYVHTGVRTEKTDVYRFVVLELETGRRPVEIDGTVLVDKVWEIWSKGKSMEAVDSRLIGRFEMREMERMLTVGLACVHPDSKKRPKMNEAEMILRGDAPNPILPPNKPEIRIQSVSQDVLLMQGDRNGSSDTPPWGSLCSRTATIPAGTVHYLALEYVHTGVPTEKTDVSSFGVVVLGVATGRRPVEIDGTVLVDKVLEMWSKGKLMEAVDSRLMGRFEMREMERMLMVGLACVHPDSKKRPKMKEAERILSGRAVNLALKLAPCPAQPCPWP